MSTLLAESQFDPFAMHPRHPDTTEESATLQGGLGHVERPMAAHEVSAFFGRVLDRSRKDDETSLVEGFDAIERLGLMYKSSTTIAFKDVAFSVKVKDKSAAKTVEKVILEKASGVVEPAELVAVMGPSGCGMLCVACISLLCVLLAHAPCRCIHRKIDPS